MSKYTTEVRFICENYAGLDESVGANDVEEVLDESWDKIFTNFPIYDENYRESLCKKILRHFYTREIGYETVGLWKMKLNMRMNEIMPYYNQMYESTLLQYDPLKDYSYSRTLTESGTKDENVTTGSTKRSSETDTLARMETSSDSLSETKSESGSESSSFTNRVDDSKTKNESGNESDSVTKGQTGTVGNVSSEASHGTSSNDKTELYNDTPQGGLTGIDNMTYLTNVTKTSGNSEENGTVNRNATETRNLQDSTSGTKTTQTSITDEGVKTTSENRSGENSKTITDSKMGTGNHTLNDSGSKNGEVTNTGSRTSDLDTSRRLVEEITGKRGVTSYAKLIEDLRKSFLNIDMMIIRDLENLFMLLW